MKRSVFFVLTTILSCVCMQTMQAQERSVFSVSYVLEETNEPPKFWHQYKLDVGKQTSHFYDWNEIQNKQINDSVCKSRGETPREDSYSWHCIGVEGFHPTPTHLHVLKNTPTENEVLVSDIINFGGSRNNIYYQEPIADYGWEMMEGDSVIGGYACQKAQMTYRGHSWVAWFTPEIAVSDGPWKLCGLPGLILDAADKEGDYHFMFTGLENATDREIFLNTNNSKKTTAKDMYKMFVKANEDRNARMPAEMLSHMGNKKPRLRLLEHLSE